MSRREDTWLIDATRDCSELGEVCGEAARMAQRICVIYSARDRDTVRGMAGAAAEFVRLIDTASPGGEGLDLKIPEGGEVLFLPCSRHIDWVKLRSREPLGIAHCLEPLVAEPPRISPGRLLVGPAVCFGWRADRQLALRLLAEPSLRKANPVEFVEAVQRWPDPPRWQSIPVNAEGAEAYPTGSSPVLTMDSRVLAVISHYRCEQWLHGCLTSIAHQTRPPDDIVVVDDGSPELPQDLVEAFPQVTLLSTTRNTGPERILNNLIHATDYDAYMVQDADDWAAHDRLELSLRGAEHTGADMVGMHEFRIDHAKKALELCVYPPDVNHAMSHGMSHYLLHCTGLISRGLAMRIGGFDEKLNLIADTDFVMRAWHAGRIVNLPSFGLFHRIRAGSLTTGSDTGYQSKARMIEDRFIKMRGMRNLELSRKGETPNVIVEKKGAVDFLHHCGPKLRMRGPHPPEMAVAS